MQGPKLFKSDLSLPELQTILIESRKVLKGLDGAFQNGEDVKPSKYVQAMCKFKSEINERLHLNLLDECGTYFDSYAPVVDENNYRNLMNWFC
jgi:hypothetical protein